MRWLMVGTSPTVVDTLPQVRERYTFDRTITCNGGIGLLRPDVYVLVDYVAGLKWHEEARAAQQLGTRLVTLKRKLSVMKDRKVDHFDEFLELPNGPPTLTKWGEFRYSGPLCMEYAVRNGATEVIVVGCDGYRTNSPADYYDGQDVGHRRPAMAGPQRTHEVLREGFQQIANVWPDVVVKQYGSPNYTIDGWEQCGL